MKVLLLFVIFICCVLIGCSIKNFYKKRKNFFYDFKNFCDDLTNDISYKNEKLEIIVKNKISIYSDDFVLLLNIFLKDIIDEHNIKKFKENIFKQLNFLSKEELNFVTNFFINLGGFSKEEELFQINEIKKEIEKYKNEAFDNNKKFSNLYFKLFFILGLIIVIFFI